MLTLKSTTTNSSGGEIVYLASFAIPVYGDYFGKWPDQCIGLTKQRTICMSGSYKEHPLLGLCGRHYRANVEAGGSSHVFYPTASELKLNNDPDVPPLSVRSENLFRELAHDAGNWDGGKTPANANVMISSERYDQLQVLRSRDLVQYERGRSGDEVLRISFTPLGRHYARVHGIEITGSN